MPENPYDLVRYPSFPHRQTHPDRLAAVGKLFGMHPAPVDGCCVLELGCSNGSNLIPMAYGLPKSRFVGVDLAAQPVADGRALIAELGLQNAELHAADLRSIGPEWGAFDYIVAHGVYSWTPPEVREGLLALCAAQLAPQGIAFISYNALPGGHVRQMLREMMLHHVRGIEDVGERIRRTREFLQGILKTHIGPASWEAQRDFEIRGLLDRDAGGLCHDELSPFNDRFYFHEFVAAAGRHGLEYLGEAEPHQMFDLTGALDGFEGDYLEREQHLDFLKARRYRQTLLARAGTRLAREIGPEQMRGFLFSAPARQVEDGKIEGSRGMRISQVSEAGAAVALALGETYPLPLPFEELVPYAGAEETLAEILFALVLSGFADLHAYDFPCQESVTERPRARGLVRCQAARANMVTSVCHVMVELDETGRRLAVLADGTRGHQELADELGVEGGAEAVRSRLEWMAGRGLMEG